MYLYLTEGKNRDKKPEVQNKLSDRDGYCGIFITEEVIHSRAYTYGREIYHFLIDDLNIDWKVFPSPAWGFLRLRNFDFDSIAREGVSP